MKHSASDKKTPGRSRKYRTKKTIKAMNKIRRNPVREQKIISQEMKIAPRTMPRTLKDVLRYFTKE